MASNCPAKDLFFDEIAAFLQADAGLQQIYYQLLRDQKEFLSFFHFLGYQEDNINIEKVIREKFHSQICEDSDLAKIIVEYPIELSYCLALINTDNRYSITPPWVLKSYPAVERIMFLLRSSPCLTGCAYCDQAQSVNDYPTQENYFVVRLVLEREEKTLCLYTQGNGYYVEEPYIGVCFPTSLEYAQPSKYWFHAGLGSTFGI